MQAVNEVSFVRKNLLRAIPKVDELMLQPQIVLLQETAPRRLVLDVVREALSDLRSLLVAAEEGALPEHLNVEALVATIAREVEARNDYHLKRVINATGVVIHTNLGRSLLAPSIARHLTEVSCYYSTLEYDLDTGKRGTRYAHVESLLCELTGAEAALVVNNNAAAVMLVLSTLCTGKEVIVSRGQLVEIGGAFRVPDVMRASGASLIEVGTTNKTHLRDYASAINEMTSAILKVHTSNYRILGFTSEVPIESLAELCKTHGIPLIEDLGSGSLIDLSSFGLMKEPTVVESMNAGADVVTFSGDKMLGGPQAGIILGRKVWIEAMKKNQLTRALRVDKMTLCALEATLKLYRDPEKALQEIPTLKMLTTRQEALLPQATALLERIEALGPTCEAALIETYSEVGGGSLPLEKLPTWAVAVKPTGQSTQRLADLLRHRPLPIIARVAEDRLIFDVRTLQEGEADLVVKALADLL